MLRFFMLEQKLIRPGSSCSIHALNLKNISFLIQKLVCDTPRVFLYTFLDPRIDFGSDFGSGFVRSCTILAL